MTTGLSEPVRGTAGGDDRLLPVRRHDIPGVYNLRDTGGYPAGARTSRWGRLFRSDALHGLDDSGRARLLQLGITTVVDLRSDDELTTSPSRLDGLPVVVHRVPVYAGAAPALPAELSLEVIYDHMIDDCGPALAHAVGIIANSDSDSDGGTDTGGAGRGGAVLVHCTAGKDRTGLVVALALLAAGVDREPVVADYAATADNLAGVWAERMLGRLQNAGHPLSREVIDLVTASPAPVMEALLDRIDREHGSVRDYLLGAGLTAADIARLSDTLLD